MINNVGYKLLDAKAAKQAKLLAESRNRLAELRTQPQTLDVRAKIAGEEIRIELGVGLLAIIDQTQAAALAE